MKRLAVVIVSLIFALTFCISAKAEVKQEYIEYIEEIAQEYQICPELIYEICMAESSFDPNAVSSTGCKGLMQINESVWKDRMKHLQVTDLFDPYQNILLGTDILMYLANYYEETTGENADISLTLMAFNEGNNGVKRAKQGKVSYYAKHILEESAELEEEHGKTIRGYG